MMRKYTTEQIKHYFSNLPELTTQAQSASQILVTVTDSSKVALAQACIQNLAEMGAALWAERCELYQMIEQLTARVAELEAMQVEEKVAA
jgi:cell division protein FtsB